MLALQPCMNSKNSLVIFSRPGFRGMQSSKQAAAAVIIRTLHGVAATANANIVWIKLVFLFSVDYL